MGIKIQCVVDRVMPDELLEYSRVLWVEVPSMAAPFSLKKGVLGLLSLSFVFNCQRLNSRIYGKKRTSAKAFAKNV